VINVKRRVPISPETSANKRKVKIPERQGLVEAVIKIAGHHGRAIVTT